MRSSADPLKGGVTKRQMALTIVAALYNLDVERTKQIVQANPFGVAAKKVSQLERSRVRELRPSYEKAQRVHEQRGGTA